MLQNDLSRYLDVELFDRHRAKEHQNEVQPEQVKHIQSKQQYLNSLKKDSNNNPVQPLKHQPGGTQLSLFDLFTVDPATRKEKPQNESFGPRPFEGELHHFLKEDSFVAANGSQVGYLRNVSDKGAEFYPLNIGQNPFTTVM